MTSSLSVNHACLKRQHNQPCSKQYQYVKYKLLVIMITERTGNFPAITKLYDPKQCQGHYVNSTLTPY